MAIAATVSGTTARSSKVSSTGSRTGIAGRDLPEPFGPWQTVWKRHRRFSEDGTWDRIHAELLADADAAGEIDWAVSADSTINRPRWHATNPSRGTGGSIEL
jgi:transposase